MDDGLTNLNWLMGGGGVAQVLGSTTTPPSTPPPAEEEKKASPAPPEVDYAVENVKPPYSYAQLISMAMQAHGGEKVVLTDIYAWIRTNFAFFRGSDNSWQNSIRHNLSLNRQFIKVARDANDRGKGSYWMLDPKSFRKDPYCIRRRNFFETQSKKPKVSVDRPQVNPAVKSFLQKAAARRHAKRHPFAGTGERLEDIGAQETIVDGDPKLDSSVNGNRFKREVEGLVGGYVPQSDQPPTTTAPGSSGDGRVKVEYNWEPYEYHPSNVVGATLPTIHLSPGTTTSVLASGSISLSPPNSEEGAVGQPVATSAPLDLHIPGPEIPDWWSSATTAGPALMSPPGSSITATSSSYASGSNPLARVFELQQLTSSGLVPAPVVSAGPTFSLLSPIQVPASTQSEAASAVAGLAAAAEEGKEGSPILDVETSDDPVHGLSARVLAPAQM